MKPTAECFPCFLRQANIASRLAKSSDRKRTLVQKEIARLLAATDERLSPPHIASLVFRRTYSVLKCRDPYLRVKKKYNRTVKALFPRLRRLLASSRDPFATAVKLALAGNIIDFGILENFSLSDTIEKTLRIPLDTGKISEIKNRIKKANTILYITDNAGEIGFDAFLLNEIRGRNPRAALYCAVKKTPVINDATREDALYFGISAMTRIIDTGGNWVGTHLRYCSAPFRRVFAKAGIIISKGQANWESLEELHDPRIVFLLKAKCPAVARLLNVKLNEAVVR